MIHLRYKFPVGTIGQYLFRIIIYPIILYPGNQPYSTGAYPKAFVVSTQRGTRQAWYFIGLVARLKVVNQCGGIILRSIGAKCVIKKKVAFITAHILKLPFKE